MNEGQVEQLQVELIELQTHHKAMSKAFGPVEKAQKHTRWANTIGTVRVLLDVFADQWTESVRKGVPGGKTQDKTSANCNDFGDE